MADGTLGGVRVQDWLGVAMVALGTGLLVWFSWEATFLTKAIAIGGLVVLIVVVGYLMMRRVSRDG